MKIAAIIANSNIFPVGPKTDPGFGYGGYSRFYEGLAYGMKDFDVDLYIVGPLETRSGKFANNVVKVNSCIGENRNSYLNAVVAAINDMNPDFVIIQNPALVRKNVTNRFKHVCRVAGYLYQKFIYKDIKYVTNSNWGNRHYNKSWPVVYQTCCPTDVEYVSTKDDYWIFISNLSRGFREKGLEFACKFASNNGMKLLVAGPVGETRGTWERMKSLENDYVKYIGPVVGDDKKKLIGKAKGVFYPISKECKEMGSTLVTESAFCGTPFVTTNTGCMPEYVKHGMTGFVCNSNNDFREACNNVDLIDPANCFSWAKDTFDFKKIAKKYLNLAGYKK